MGYTDIKAIIFDYGGTLDTGGAHWSDVIYGAWRSAGLDISREDFNDAYVSAERRLGRGDIIGPGFTFADTLDVKIALQFDRLASRRLLPDGADCLAAEITGICHSIALNHINRAAPLLQRLAGRFPLALVSNFYSNLTAVLRDFGIRDCFRSVIESAVIGIRKPDSRLFTIAASALGVSAADCLVVGDSLDKDIIPAAAVGCKTALLAATDIERRKNQATAYQTFGSLEEITEAVLSSVNTTSVDFN